jgi:hypothetical protein
MTTNDWNEVTKFLVFVLVFVCAAWAISHLK